MPNSAPTAKSRDVNRTASWSSSRPPSSSPPPIAALMPHPLTTPVSYPAPYYAPVVPPPLSMPPHCHGIVCPSPSLLDPPHHTTPLRLRAPPLCLLWHCLPPSRTSFPRPPPSRPSRRSVVVAGGPRGLMCGPRHVGDAAAQLRPTGGPALRAAQGECDERGLRAGPHPEYASQDDGGG